jgi:tRNA (cmo5U34)-methyltransferase
MEPMGEFFDARVSGYDKHLAETFPDFVKEGYEKVAEQVPLSDERIRLLSLGGGSGAEIWPVLRRAPRARITVIDLSEGMLDELKVRLQPFTLVEAKLIHDSFLTWELGVSRFDFAVSTFAMHHFTPDVKRGLYERVFNALKPIGVYIEGDVFVTEERQHEIAAWYRDHYPATHVADAENPKGVAYHIDIPSTKEMQTQLLGCAGFATVDWIWRSDAEESAILRAER